jgi:hypothetical protein
MQRPLTFRFDGLLLLFGLNYASPGRSRARFADGFAARDRAKGKSLCTYLVIFADSL